MVSYLLLYLALVSCIPKISYTGKVTFTHLYLVLVSFLLLYLALVFLPTPIPFIGLFLTPTPCVGLLSTPINTLQWSISWVWWGESRLKKLFLFILIYVIAPPLLFPKSGNTLFNSHYFRFYEHLHRGHISKYR